MKIISNKDYELFLHLKSKAKSIYNLSSAKEITNLKDDIDFPIRKCVAMLALMGCEPMFSCCGFDYQGQPIHKSHQYGHPYITLKKTVPSDALHEYLQSNEMLWKSKFIYKNVIVIECNFDSKSANPFWRDKDCIHFSEECVIAIQKLEVFLLAQSKLFSDEVTLFDTNEENKRRGPYWQYPPKKPWTISKQDVIG